MAFQFSGGAPDDNVKYFLYCYDTAAERCFIHSDGDLANHDGTYGTISDISKKQDFAPMRSYWDDFASLDYQKYRHITDVEVSADAPYRVGLVAQEVETIFPSLVAGEEGDKWVKSSIIEGPIMAKVVQESQTRILALEAQIDNIQKRLN